MRYLSWGSSLKSMTETIIESTSSPTREQKFNRGTGLLSSFWILGSILAGSGDSLPFLKSLKDKDQGVLREQ